MPEVKSRKTSSRSTTQHSPATWAKEEQRAAPPAPRTPRADAAWRPFLKKPRGRRSWRMRKTEDFLSLSFSHIYSLLSASPNLEFLCPSSPRCCHSSPSIMDIPQSKAQLKLLRPIESYGSCLCFKQEI